MEILQKIKVCQKDAFKYIHKYYALLLQITAKKYLLNHMHMVVLHKKHISLVSLISLKDIVKIAFLSSWVTLLP